MPSPSKFRFFPQLPTEIRLTIWTLCLPRRVHTLERVNPRRNSTTHSQGSFWRSPAFGPSPPLLSRVCREARQHALRSSGHISNYSDHPPPALWLQPGLDIVYLRWNWEDRQSPGSLDDVYTVNSAYYSGRLCISKDLLLPSEEEDFFRGMTTPWITRYIHYYHNHISRLQRLLETHIVVEEFSFTLPQSMARKSGLFGLLGDEPIQLLDPNDMKTMSKMRRLLKRARGSSCQETADTLRFLTCVKRNPTMFLLNIDQLRRNLIRLWVCCCWQRGLFYGTGGDLGIDEVWLPRDNQEYPYNILFEYAQSPETEWWGEIGLRDPNMENPWVAEVVAKMPKFHPKVMIRANFKKKSLGIWGLK